MTNHRAAKSRPKRRRRLPVKSAKRKFTHNRYVAPETVEERILMSAVNGNYADQESFEAAVSQELEARTDQFASALADAAASLDYVPASPGELEDIVRDMVDQSFDFDSPQSVLEQGWEVASFEDWNAGTAEDLVLLDLKHGFDLPAVTVSATGSFGADDGVQLSADGTFNLQGSLEVNATLGLNADGEFFVVEGANIGISYATDTDDYLTGTLSIPGLGDAKATVTGDDGGAMLQASTSLQVTDNDAIDGERFYAADFMSIAGDMAAYEMEGRFAADATLSIDSPVKYLPDFLQKPALAAGLTQSLDWDASLAVDLANGEVSYEVRSESVDAIDSLFSDPGSLEEQLFDYMLGEFKEHNPIPESAQKFLATDIPLIESNIMDLLDIPESAQYLIAPAAFEGPQVDGAARDYLNVDVSFFEIDNLTRFLSGQEYDIVSLSIDERFDQDLATVTVLPETVILSYFGIANATVEAEVTPGFFIDLDLTMGLDSKGLYVEGATESELSDPQVEFGGSVTVTGIAEGDFLFLVDFARITIDAGIEGFGTVTLVSPHASSRMRAADITASNTRVGLGVDLNLGLKGEAGLVAIDELDVDYEVGRTFEIYRHNAGTDTGGIEGEVTKFRENMESKGKTYIYAAAAITQDPTLVTTAAILLYNDHGEDVIRTAHSLVAEHGVELSPAFTAMRDKFGMQIVEFARILRSEVGTGLTEIARFLQAESQNIGEVAKVLGRDLGANLYDTAKALIDGADASISSAVKALRSELGASEKQIAEILARLGEDFADKLVPFLESAADALATEILKRMPVDKIADIVADLPRGLTRALPSIIGDNNVAHIMKIMDPARINDIAGRLTYKKTAELLARLKGNSLASIGKALGDYQASKILRSIPEAKMGELLRDVRNGTLKKIVDQVDWNTITKVSGKLADSARSYVANRLPNGGAVRAFVQGLSGGQALDTITKLKNSGYQIDAVKHWVSMDVANHLFRKMDSNLFYRVVGQFSATDIARFATSTKLVRRALKNLFAHANPATAGQAIGKLAGFRLDAVVRSMPVSDIRRILPTVDGNSLDRVFRNLSARKVGETLNGLSRSMRRTIFRTVSSSILKDSEKHWDSLTRGIHGRL